MIVAFKGKYNFLSNFYYHAISVSGMSYLTMEHYFQAQKTVDKNEFAQIVGARTPGEAKRLGRNATLMGDWEYVKIKVMEQGLIVKFSDENLSRMLTATYPNELIEGNHWHDDFLGKL